MPENNGLFSGLRFSDILLPGIASVWSAYNPYVAQGLNTGMNLFNSLANFQSNAQYWKHLKQQEKEYNERVAAAQEAMDPKIAWHQQELARMRTGAEEPVRASDILNYTQQRGVLPDAVDADIFNRAVSGPPDMNQAVNQYLGGDEPLAREYRGRMEQLVADQAYRAGMPLAAGASIAGSGTLSQQQLGHTLNMAEMAQAAKNAAEDRARAFTYAQLNREEGTAAALKQIEAYKDLNQTRLSQARQYAEDVASLYAVDEAKMTEEDLQKLIDKGARSLYELGIANDGTPQWQSLIEMYRDRVLAFKAELDRRAGKTPENSDSNKKSGAGRLDAAFFGN